MTAVLPLPRESVSPGGAARRRRGRPSAAPPSSRHTRSLAAAGGTLGAPATSTGPEPRQAALPERVRQILAQGLEYRVCRNFKRLHVLSHEFGQPLLPDYARTIDERTLLSAEQEADLFVRMNYCRFRADILRRQLP